jgi:hypothetical protein
VSYDLKKPAAAAINSIDRTCWSSPYAKGRPAVFSCGKMLPIAATGRTDVRQT